MRRKLVRSSSSFSKILDGFSLEDYQPFSDTSAGMTAIIHFRTTVEEDGKHLKEVDGHMLAVTGNGNGQADLHFTIDRDAYRNGKISNSWASTTP